MSGFFSRLKGGLTKTRDNMVKGLDNVFHGYSEIDDDFYEELEETLIMGDIGVNATSKIMDELREQVKTQHLTDTESCRKLLIQDIRDQMQTDGHAYDFEDHKTVIFVIGVNGVGKTTSVGKLAAIFRAKGGRRTTSPVCTRAKGLQRPPLRRTWPVRIQRCNRVGGRLSRRCRN